MVFLFRRAGSKTAFGGNNQSRQVLFCFFSFQNATYFFSFFWHNSWKHLGHVKLIHTHKVFQIPHCILFPSSCARPSLIQVWWDVLWWRAEEKNCSVTAEFGWLQNCDIQNDYCCIINIAGPSDHAHATVHMNPNAAAASSVNHVVTNTMTSKHWKYSSDLNWCFFFSSFSFFFLNVLLPKLHISKRYSPLLKVTIFPQH